MSLSRPGNCGGFKRFGANGLVRQKWSPSDPIRSFSSNLGSKRIWNPYFVTKTHIWTPLVPHLVQWKRHFAAPIIQRDELSKLIEKGKAKSNVQDRNYVLVDVREPYELEREGRIETSVNIPLGQLDTALKLSDQEFEQKYKFPKIKKDANLIFMCRAGVRAQKACDIAESNGYKGPKNYKGSAKEWFGLPDNAPPPPTK